jgi:hypothetical protein
MEELLRWLSWIDKWTSSSSAVQQVEEGHDRRMFFPVFLHMTFSSLLTFLRFGMA